MTACKSLQHITIIILLSFFSLIANAERKLPKLGHQLTAIKTPITAPPFTLPDMDENPHSLESYKGKVVLLNFWATWCPPCRREIPSMERLYQHFKDKSFTILAINQMEDPDHVFAYTGQLEVDPTFALLFDPTSSVSLAYEVSGLPTTYLIDKQGEIRYRAIGGREFDHPEVGKLIQDLLDE